MGWTPLPSTAPNVPKLSSGLTAYINAERTLAASSHWGNSIPRTRGAVVREELSDSRRGHQYLTVARPVDPGPRVGHESASRIPRSLGDSHALLPASRPIRPSASARQVAAAPDIHI